MKRRHFRDGPLVAGELYCGRGRQRVNLHTAKVGEYGWLGNPYDVETFGRKGCIEMFEKALHSKLVCDEKFAQAFWALKGKVHTVVCWCKANEACHADVIGRLLE